MSGELLLPPPRAASAAVHRAHAIPSGLPREECVALYGAGSNEVGAFNLHGLYHPTSHSVWMWKMYERSAGAAARAGGVSQQAAPPAPLSDAILVATRVEAAVANITAATSGAASAVAAVDKHAASLARADKLAADLTKLRDDAVARKQNHVDAASRRVKEAEAQERAVSNVLSAAVPASFAAITLHSEEEKARVMGACSAATADAPVSLEACREAQNNLAAMQSAFAKTLALEAPRLPGAAAAAAADNSKDPTARALALGKAKEAARAACRAAEDAYSAAKAIALVETGYNAAIRTKKELELEKTKLAHRLKREQACLAAARIELTKARRDAVALATAEVDDAASATRQAAIVAEVKRRQDEIARHGDALLAQEAVTADLEREASKSIGSIAAAAAAAVQAAAQH